MITGEAQHIADFVATKLGVDRSARPSPEDKTKQSQACTPVGSSCEGPRRVTYSVSERAQPVKHIICSYLQV